MRDRNIRDAANVQVIGMTALGAGTGFGMAGWFDFSTALGAGAGAGIGYIAGAILLSHFGGRQTR